MEDMFKSSGSVEVGTTLKQHMLRTFTWMFGGVLLTFITAFLVGLNPEFVYNMYTQIPGFQFIMMIAQFGVVIALVARIHKMSLTSARALFVGYSILTGITFSVLSITFDYGSIALAFGMTCLFFGALVLIGYTTKMDLSRIGAVCYAGLFAFIIYSVLGMLFGWSTDTFVFSIIGLVLFMGITAWDTQKMKRLYEANKTDEKLLANLSIYSALDLYLDFINIFLYILRIVGSRK